MKVETSEMLMVDSMVVHSAVLKESQMAQMLVAQWGMTTVEVMVEQLGDLWAE
jgi:hypothetical protein